MFDQHKLENFKEINLQLTNQFANFLCESDIIVLLDTVNIVTKPENTEEIKFIITLNNVILVNPKTQ